jgi:ubiquinone/menaquinone biosynthesis C-methylase UbiE
MKPSHEHAARMAALFDSLADRYDQVGVDFFQPIADSLLAELGPRAGESWLDIGCGRGAVLLPAATSIGPSGTATGTDISPAMVESVRRIAAEQGLMNVRVLVDDAQDPAPGGEPVDAISSSLVLFFLADPAAAVAAWLPLLSPGGRIGITTFGGVDPRWAEVDSVFDAYLPPAMKDARTSGRTGPFSSDAGMEALVAGAGFADVDTVSGTVPVRFTDVDHWHEFTWSVGQRAMWLSVPEAERPAVLDQARRRLDEIAAPDGSITFSQPIRHTLAVRPQ